MNNYEKLKQYKENYPDLTFDNNGFEYISPEIKESHKEQIKEIEEILKAEILGFEEFNNFKPRENTFDIRCQYDWCAGTENNALGSFTGVGYFNIEQFK